jgi:hypothetical protein
MQSVKPNTDDRQISLSVLGVICGLMGGGLGGLLVLTMIGHIESGVELLSPIPHNAGGTMTFLLCLYGMWVLASWRLAKDVRMAFWALATFPLPSMLISSLFALYL